MLKFEGETDAISTSDCGRMREDILTDFGVEMPEDLLYDIQPSVHDSFIVSGVKFAISSRAIGGPKAKNGEGEADAFLTRCCARTV